MEISDYSQKCDKEWTDERHEQQKNVMQNLTQNISGITTEDYR